MFLTETHGGNNNITYGALQSEKSKIAMEMGGSFQDSRGEK